MLKQYLKIGHDRSSRSVWCRFSFNAI